MPPTSSARADPCRRATADRCRVRGRAAPRASPAPALESRYRLLRLRGISVDQRPGELELDGERDQVLLRAIVQVPFDRSPGLVSRGDDAPPRRLELIGLTANLVERCLQGRVEPARCVSRRRAGAPAPPRVRSSSGVKVSRRVGPLNQHQSEQLAGVRHGGRADEGVLPAVQAARGANLHPAMTDQPAWTTAAGSSPPEGTGSCSMGGRRSTGGARRPPGSSSSRGEAERCAQAIRRPAAPSSSNGIARVMRDPNERARSPGPDARPVDEAPRRPEDPGLEHGREHGRQRDRSDGGNDERPHVVGVGHPPREQDRT